MTDNAWTPLTLLEECDALKGESHLAQVANSIFEFTQFLLDEEDNLTKTGNLNGEAKNKLRARTLELLGVESADSDAQPS